MKLDYSTLETEALSNNTKQNRVDSIAIPNQAVRQLKGIVPKPDKPVSIEQIDEAIVTSITEKNSNNLLNNNSITNDANILDQIQEFPTTRYYGSKKRLLPWIYENTKDLEFNTVLDAFGGTASTSLLFQAMGKKITFNDGLKCNQIMATALLQNNKELLPQKEFEEFIKEVIPNKGFISHTFHNDYFTEEENQWLDGIALKIHSLTCEKVKSIYFYCLFQACLQKRPFNLFHRKNLNLRLRDVKRSFGNLKTWNTEFSVLMLRSYKQLSKMTTNFNDHPIILPATDASEIKGKFDLVYLDPPYINTKPTSDTYLKKYHFLEGLSNYHTWGEYVTDNGSRFQHKIANIEITKNKVAFEEYLYNLLEKYKKSIVVLSYMSNAFPDQNSLTSIFNEIFDKVDIHEKELSHALAKSKRNELLLIGK